MHINIVLHTRDQLAIVMHVQHSVKPLLCSIKNAFTILVLRVFLVCPLGGPNIYKYIGTGLI